MRFTVAQVLTDVRELVQDTGAQPRYSDLFLVRKTNLLLRRAVIMRPDLFTAVHPLSCAAGAMQTCPADSVRMIDVLANEAGAAVKEVTGEVLDLMYPAWGTATAGPALNWMRYPRDPNRFYVYPPATAAAALSILYAKCPATLALGDVVPLQDVYMPAIVDGVAWMVEAVDAEHAQSGRAKMLYDSFAMLLTGALQAREITDTEDAGKPGDTP